MLTQKIIEKEFALSGSEQNPDLTSKSVARGPASRASARARPAPVEAFKQQGADFVVERDLAALVRGMNALTDEPLLELADVEREIVARDREIENPYTKDLQVTAIRGARRYLPDRITRVAAPHRILDPKAGPLIAVRLHILTRKTLGGLQTDLVQPRAASRRRAARRACTPPARWRASAAAACTATARSRARSSAAACSPGGSPAARSRRRSRAPERQGLVPRSLESPCPPRIHHRRGNEAPMAQPIALGFSAMGERTGYTPGTFCWTDLTTTDQAGAKAFYGGLFGWVAEDMPVGEVVYYSMQRVDGKDVAAISPQQQQQRDAGVPPTWNSYVSVADADAVADRARGARGHRACAAV